MTLAKRFNYVILMDSLDVVHTSGIGTDLEFHVT